MKYLIWLLLIFLIIFRYFTTRPVYKNGDTVRITATVYSDPITYANSQGVKIGGLTTYLPTFPIIGYGDRIIVAGIINDGGSNSGAKKLEKPKLISIEENRGLGSGVRKKIISFYQQVLPQPVSGLVAGVILGSKGTLTADFWNQVKLTGVAHVVVASGTNVTFVVSFLMGVTTYFLSRRKAILFVALGIIMYLFISGFDAPLVRAAIMSFLAFSGQETGRLVNSWRVLFLTAGIMLVIQPDWIIDIGFALSFVSTVSIMLFNKRIEKWLSKVPNLVRKDLATTLSAQIGVAPILFVAFGQFNIWSPLINALVLWTVPFVMILGSIGGIVGLVIPIIGKLILYLAYPLLWWFVKIVAIFS